MESNLASIRSNAQAQPLDGSRLPDRVIRSLFEHTAFLREIFVLLKPALSEEELAMPEALKLSRELRDLARKLAEALEQSLQDSEDSIKDVRRLTMVDSTTLKDSEAVVAFTSDVRQKIDSINRCLCDRGLERLNGIQDDLIKFQVTSAAESKRNLIEKAKEQKSERRTIRDKKVAVGSLENPASSNDALGVIIARLAPILNVFVDRVSENLDGKLALVEQEQELCATERQVVGELLADADTALLRLGDCDDWWMTARREISGTKFCLDKIQQQPVQPQSERELSDRLLTVVNILTHFQLNVKEVLQEASMVNEPSLTNELETFEKHAKIIVPTLTQLISAKDILRPPHHERLPANVHALARSLFKQLERIQVVFNQWFFYTQHDSTGPFAFITEISSMLRNVPSLSETAQLIYDRMSLTLMSHISRGRSKQAQSKQKQEDQDGTSQDLGRRLATQVEVLEALARLKGAMKAVREFSTELGIALLHHNRCSGCNTSRAMSDDTSELLPRDPFAVDQTVAKRVLGVLKVETARLKSFAYEDMDGNSSD